MKNPIKIDTSVMKPKQICKVIETLVLLRKNLKKYGLDIKYRPLIK